MHFVKEKSGEFSINNNNSNNYLDQFLAQMHKSTEQGGITRQ